MAKKEEKQSAVENPEAIVEGYNKFEQWAIKNKTKIGLGVGILVIAVGAFIYFQMQSTESAKQSELKIYTSEYYFGKDSLQLALEGDGDKVMGFRRLAKRYEGTPAANRANLYIGTIELKQGNYQAALKALEKFSSDDYLWQARAYSLMGDCYMELEQYAKASEKYIEACNYKPNKEFTPFYLMKLAASYEAQGKFADAKVEYDKLLQEYPGTQFKDEAEKYRAIAEGKSKKG